MFFSSSCITLFYKNISYNSRTIFNCKITGFLHRRNCSSNIRVRFAPSPTGLLHLGGLRTALYNYLFAKSKKGKFILRIEDTDTTRTISGAAQDIERDLIWLSLTPDESPTVGGPFEPYFQSERAHIYKEHSQLLLDKGMAYKCFCSKERMKSLSDAKLTYDNKCRSLTSREISELENRNTPYCIRLKLQKEIMHLNDLIYGKRELGYLEVEGDTIMVKSNGVPTYHFANVVDDHTMNITHVLRGNEWLASTSKHLHLYKCFNWEPPKFAHLPNILNPDGTKLSKRQQDLHIRELRSQGYSAEAVLNFAKLAGGGFENIEHEDINSLDQLIERFQLNLINVNSSVLDFPRLQNYSRLDLKKKIASENDLKTLINELKEILSENFKDSLCSDYSDKSYEKILIWGQDRIYKLSDFTSSNFKYLWRHPEITKGDLAIAKVDSQSVLSDLIKALEGIESSCFGGQTSSEAMKAVQDRHQLKAGPFMKLIRIAVCGIKVGPPINEVFTLLGKEIILHRLNKAHSCIIK